MFLGQARLAAGWIVGDLNDGWRMATALLAHERVSTGTSSVAGNSDKKRKTGRNPLPAKQLIELAQKVGRSDDNEIQRNTLGERVLGLPKEPVPDADIAYRDLLRNSRAQGT